MGILISPLAIKPCELGRAAVVGAEPSNATAPPARLSASSNAARIDFMRERFTAVLLIVLSTSHRRYGGRDSTPYSVADWKAAARTATRTKRHTASHR